MFKFKYNDSDLILNIEDNYIKIGNEKKELKNCKLKNRKKVYYKITNDCNLNCVYCFQRYDSKYMKNVQINEYDEIISKFSDDKDTDIIIFGGEPFIDKNSENLQYLFDKETQKNKLSFFTNGCYSAKMGDLIKNNKSSINYLVITLDGPEKIHNNRRIFIGDNSYKCIIKNLFELQKEKIPFFIQINIDSKNIDSLEELLDNLDSAFGLANINILLNRVLRVETTISELRLLEKFIELTDKYTHAHLDVNSKVYKNLSIYLSGKGYFESRCGIGDTTMIFDFLTNKIYSCPQDTSTEIGYFTKNTIKTDDTKKCAMRIVSEKKNEICASCKYIKFCSFNCYLERDNILVDCKEKTEEILEYIFKNFNKFFILK